MISIYVSVGSFGIMEFFQERFKNEWVILHCPQDNTYFNKYFTRGYIITLASSKKITITIIIAMTSVLCDVLIGYLGTNHTN